ncbi:Crp/Fnr family transcriptional regulator [Fulvitalea axinellae]|uniref:Crp/Fnr family transcriptional regulator n=1 Tax=Fulvitalea axinellae TaxID=1182444 RepID=A0AAU9CZ18_9BACT|nr:Crp/Fnr family transcriptional regulator [Fulvitalea axinellae]
MIDILAENISASGSWTGQKTLRRGEFLSLPGDVETDLYYVKSGSLRVFMTDGEDEHCVRFGYRGSFITALDSYMAVEPTVYFIQALKACELKSIRKDAFLKFIETSASMRKLYGRLLEVLVCQQMERERDLLTSSPKERYERVLKRSPQLFQEVPHKYIASYLRMTPETLSRMKKC